MGSWDINTIRYSLKISLYVASFIVPCHSRVIHSCILNIVQRHVCILCDFVLFDLSGLYGCSLADEHS